MFKKQVRFAFGLLHIFTSTHPVPAGLHSG